MSAARRIAMVGACPFPVPQGSQTLLAETARGLQALGHDVHLLVYGHGLGPDPDDLTIHRARHIPGARRTENSQVEYTAEDVPTAYRAFQAMVALG